MPTDVVRREKREFIPLTLRGGKVDRRSPESRGQWNEIHLTSTMARSPKFGHFRITSGEGEHGVDAGVC
jgi:hypothetical protein